MGYQKVYVAQNVQTGQYKNIQIVKCNLITDVLKDVGFHKDLLKRYAENKVC